MMFLVAVFTAITMFLTIRLYPLWQRRDQGCDAYNILFNAEALRRSKKLPIKVAPLFILEDEEQWYPPGFLIFCAFIPEKLLDRYYWAINHVVDFISASLIMLVVWQHTQSLYAVAVSGLVYAITPALLTEFSSLNVRPYGLLLFNIFLLCAFYVLFDQRYFWIAIIAGVALFYTHKLSIQQLWFTLPLLSLADGNIYWLLLLPGIYVAAILLWPRGSVRILRGHVNIIRFWHRNWPRLGAHIVRQSEPYGDGVTRTQYYKRGFGFHMYFMKDMIHQNYFILPYLYAIYIQIGYLDEISFFFAVWAGSVYITGVAIHFLKPLRGIGLGRQYFKYALLPVIAGCGIALNEYENIILLLLLLGALCLTLRQYYFIVQSLRCMDGAGSSGVIDGRLKELLEKLKNMDNIRLLVLPVYLCDLVAYKCRKAVYWGTHSDIFDNRLEEFFPVFKHRLEHYIKDGEITHILIDERFITPGELGLKSKDLIEKSGLYGLYNVTTS